MFDAHNGVKDLVSCCKEPMMLKGQAVPEERLLVDCLVPAAGTQHPCACRALTKEPRNAQLPARAELGGEPNMVQCC